MAVMVASCMAFGRLAQDMEITAIRAAGINPLLLNLMPIILGGLLTYGMVLFNNHLLPEANHRLKNIMLDIAQKKPCLRIRPLVTMEDIQGYDLQVGAVNYKKSEIYKVKLFDKMTGREIFARSGSFYADSTKITLLLKDGELHEPLTDGRYRKMGFDEQSIYIPIDAQTIQRDREYRGDRELSAQGLKNKIQEVAKERSDNRYKKQKINGLLVEYHKKYSIHIVRNHIFFEEELNSIGNRLCQTHDAELAKQCDTVGPHPVLNESCATPFHPCSDSHHS